MPIQNAVFPGLFGHTSGRARRTRYGSVEAITKVIASLACLGLLHGSALAQPAAEPSATLAGVVVDARTGAPLAGILVAAEGGPAEQTGEDGTFVLSGLAAGEVRLSASAVGYGLVQRRLLLEPGERLTVTIPLSEGAATYTETVSVSADRFRRGDPGVPSQHTLGAGELQNLRGVLADDALRAVQVLPGVATGDDFRSEFSVRGSDFSHLNFTVDGFATPFLMHMVRAVEERANTGSVAMVNSDVLAEVTLLNGAYVQRSGNRTGAELAFTLREGSRDRTMVRASVSGTSASGTVEGPLGGSRRGSWLVSTRKSYLDLLVDRLSDEGLSFGFADAQAKLQYDLTARHAAFVTLIAGRSRLREIPQRPDEDDPFVGDNGSAVGIGGWRLTGARVQASAGVMAAVNEFDNSEAGGVPLERGRTDQQTGRFDLAVALARGVRVESGALIERTAESLRKTRRTTGGAAAVINDYAAQATRTGGYARVQLDAGRLTLAPGVRGDRSTLTDQATWSPWMQGELALTPALRLRAGGGVYQQFPDFEEATGALAARDPRPERSVHADVSLEYRLASSMRVQLTAYDREDDRVLRRPGADTRLLGGRLVRGSLTAPYANRALGDARGAEVLLQRSGPAALSGWVSYAYGRVRYEDVVSGETYAGDLDQRHTVNAYLFYRMSHRFSASAKFRSGSNFPIPGYYVREGDRYRLSERRNLARLPPYARLDLRGNRTFSMGRRQLTVFVEVLNVLNRENVRYNPPRVNTATREVTRLFDSLVPVVPSAGLLLEF